MTEAGWLACDSFWEADIIGLGISFRKLFHLFVSGLPVLVEGSVCASCREGLALVEVVADDKPAYRDQAPTKWKSALAVHEFLYEDKKRKPADPSCRVHRMADMAMDLATGHPSLSDIWRLIEDIWLEKATGVARDKRRRRGNRDRSHAAYRGPGPNAALVLLRDVLGNPFQPIEFDSTSLPAPVLAQAEAAYNERQPGHTDLDAPRLAVLADALEDTGNIPQTILDHLRQPGPHIRGCWALDIVLDKEREMEDDEYGEEPDEERDISEEFKDDFI
jgi:hypothetical protein